MIAFISLCYGSLYFLIFNKLGLLKKTAGNISAFAGVGVAMIAAIIFMWYTYAPMSVDARMFRHIIAIVPNVKGHVVEVPIVAKKTIAQGDTLFRIDPVPYEFTVRQLEGDIERLRAEWRLAKINVDRAASLLQVQAAAQLDLDTWTAKMEAAAAAIVSSEAKLERALWELKETDVKAPTEGYVVNLQLRPGNYVTTVPMASSLAFISYETSVILASFSQSAVRRIDVGNETEIVFTNIPGKTFKGAVKRIVGLSSQSQMAATSQLPSLTGAPANDRWAVLVELEDEGLAQALPQGAGGTITVYTNAGKPVHVISKVAIRMNAWLGYLTSP